MTTGDQSATASAGELPRLRHAAEALDEVQTRSGPRVRRAAVRRRVRRVREGLLAPVARKHGWQLAEALGERGPQGVQRLLLEADWDQEAVRNELRSYVLAHLGEEAGILVVDETGFRKKGKQSAGGAPPYSGPAGGRANCPIGVFLLDARAHGAAFSARELFLPAEWTADRVRCREAGLPDAQGFAPKGELAQHLRARACAAGVRAAWVVGASVYGSDALRTWLQGQQPPSGLAVAQTPPVGSAGRAQPVGVVAALLPAEAWTPRSALGRRRQPGATTG
jgi:SRSO17 transposase